MKLQEGGVSFSKQRIPLGLGLGLGLGFSHRIQSPGCRVPSGTLEDKVKNVSGDSSVLSARAGQF